jgi:hypothetical protein
VNANNKPSRSASKTSVSILSVVNLAPVKLARSARPSPGPAQAYDSYGRPIRRVFHSLIQHGQRLLRLIALSREQHPADALIRLSTNKAAYCGTWCRLINSMLLSTSFTIHARINACATNSSPAKANAYSCDGGGSNSQSTRSR